MKKSLEMVILYSRLYESGAEFQKGEMALTRGETPVGCVLVHDEKIIGSGMNDTNTSTNVGNVNVEIFLLK